MARRELLAGSLPESARRRARPSGESVGSAVSTVSTPMAFNFSVADSNGKVKLPFYWIAASQEPTVIIGEKCGSTIRLWAVNDTLVPFKGKCKVSKTAADGSVTELSEIGFECPPNDKVEIGTVSVAENALLIFDWGRKNHLITGDAPYSLDAWFGWRKTLLEEYALYNPQK